MRKSNDCRFVAFFVTLEETFDIYFLLLYQTDVYFMVNKKCPCVVDVKLFFIFIIVDGMFYSHLSRLQWVARAENATRLTRKQ